jgi:hypothetical protein
MFGCRQSVVCSPSEYTDMSNFKEGVGSIKNSNQIMDTANSTQDNATISSSTSSKYIYTVLTLTTGSPCQYQQHFARTSKFFSFYLKLYKN